MRKTKERIREDEIIVEMTRCLHFVGLKDECKAGINVRDLVGGETFGWAMRTPCLTTHGKCTVVCEKRQLPTREEAEAEVNRADVALARTLTAIAAAHADAKERGYGVGSSGRGSFPCPVECGGTLSYTVASVNGHIHGRCSTDGCVWWME